ncbi:MAG: hypothetical protein LUD72_08980 [Bacteroidales bacterium]|nr:hypothetical protein [Bacteroidales bacterium]
MAMNIGLGELLGWNTQGQNEDTASCAPAEDLRGTHSLPVHSSFVGIPPAPVGKPVGRVSVYAPDVKSTNELLAMKVTDDSLLSKSILPGDVLVIRKGGKARDGRLVAVVYDRDMEIREIEHEADAVVLFTPGSTDLPEKFDFAKMADGTLRIIGECINVVRGFDVENRFE